MKQYFLKQKFINNVCIYSSMICLNQVYLTAISSNITLSDSHYNSMNKNKKGTNEDDVIPPTTYKFYLGSRQRYIHINCQFEAANIQVIRQMSEFHYRLSCLDDGLKTGNRVNSKSWFYFSVHGFPKNTKGKFVISRLQTLMAVYSQYPKSYRPVYRQTIINNENKEQQWSGWQRISTQCPIIQRQNGQLECTFDFPFKNEHHKVEFAFAYPYTYTRNIEYLTSLNQYYSNDQFYFHKEILVKSPDQRDVHLLTITSHDQHNKEQEDEELFNPNLFPEKCRPNRFKKPVILITARVHPGQTAASFAMEGVINFLVNNQDVRSYLLKKMFVFMIVPMINVDGVYHGHFRMDSYGKNLNRYYIDPCLQKQPAVYAIKELATHLVKDNRLSFYFDLHAHNAKKGAFIYGNAINDFVQQVQSQVFCKLFAMNHSGFQYQYCNFSLKQMNSKDKNEERTKQGCGRVVMHRLANIIHSYSLECGIISPIKTNIVPPPSNQSFSLGDKGLIQNNTINSQSQPVYFTQQSYRELGKSLLISILDVFDKNPYNRVYNSQHKSMQLLRRVTAFQVFHTAQRFRMFQKYVYGKVKNINELIRQVLNSKLHYRQLYNFYCYNDPQLKHVQWPENIPGLMKPKHTIKLRKFKSFQQPKIEYCLSFINDLKANKDQLEQEVTPELISNQNLLQDAESFSSETQDDNKNQEIDQQQFRAIMESYHNASRQNMTEAESSTHANLDDMEISSWKVSETNQATETLNDRVWMSERDIGSIEDREDSCASPPHLFKEIREVRQINKLKLFEKVQEFENKEIKMASESPSVRVRRLLKQENAIKKPKLSTAQMKEKLTQMIAIPNSLAHSGAFLSNNTPNRGDRSQVSVPQERQLCLFEQIKMEIKQQLRRHKQRKGISCTGIKAQNRTTKGNEGLRATNFHCLRLNPHINSLIHNKHKSQSLNRAPSKSALVKTQLPALNSHILIITSNSSKGLVQE